MPSVSDILRKRMDPADPWMLALVQREAVWDEFRIARLFDSLLRHYPVGALVLCQSRGAAHVLDAERRATTAGSSWQILDGQQRTNALAELFLSSGEESCFFLHMSARLPEDLKARGKDERIRQYLTWFDRDEQTHGASDDAFRGPRGSQSDRSHWLDLSVFGNKLISGTVSFPNGYADWQASDWRDWLKSIDPDFASILPGESSQESFIVRARRLAEIWADTELIPIQKVVLDGPEHILAAFTRLNVEGVRTAPVEIFFAGVKTRWPRAEEQILPIQRRSGKLMDRRTALEIIARLATFETTGGDMLPLDLNRLRGDEGANIVQAMQHISVNHEFLQRVELLSNYLREKSGLGYGLRFVDRNLLPHVFGWAASHRQLESADLSDAALYLLGSTLFRLNSRYRDTFSRLAMVLSLKSGKESSAFPTEAILDETCELPGLDSLPQTSTPEMIRNGFVNSAPWRLFLSVAQSIPFDPGHEVEWDHIYAQSLQGRMKLRRPGWPRVRFHEQRGLIWRTGNVCVLDARLNEAAQDDRPRRKLARLKNGEYGFPQWPESLFLTGDEHEGEIALLFSADKMLEVEDRSQFEQIDQAMGYFGEFVKSREDRLWMALLGKFPAVQVFIDKLGRSD